MRDQHQTSDEVAANLLDQVQLADELFLNQEDQAPEVATVTMVEPVAAESVITEEKVPAPLPMTKRLNVPQSPAEEKTMQTSRAGGFSALLDHLKAEALRHEQRSKERQETLRTAA